MAVAAQTVTTTTPLYKLYWTVYRHAYIVKILDFGFRAFFKKFGKYLDDTSFFLVFRSKVQFSNTILLAVLMHFSQVYYIKYNIFGYFSI